VSGGSEVNAARVRPGTRAEIGNLNFLITRVLGAATGGNPPAVFTTLARNRGLFRRWLLFAGGLMPGGSLPRIDTELVILRVAHNAGCEYEWRHHAQLGQAAGLTLEQVENVRQGSAAPGWSEQQLNLLSAADELHTTRTISDELWRELSAQLSETKLIELCLLIGHYEMLAMTLNALQIPPDPPAARTPSHLVKVVQAFIERRSAKPEPNGD
jgi:AhpD family alkylhydroperoxidase